MTSIIAIISALSPIVLGLLKSTTGIPATTLNLISGIEQAVAEFLTLIKTGGSSANQVTAASVLAAIQASISILQQETTLSPVALSYIAALDKALQAGMAAYTATTTVDPNQLQPIT